MSDPSRGPSSGKAPARPRQLTMAAGFVIGGSVLLLLLVFDTLTTLNSVEMREKITEVITSPSGDGLGITMSQALTSMRVGLMIAGACAAATAVLGVAVLQPNRAARLALSILAVPILLTAPLTGGITGALVVVCDPDALERPRTRLVRRPSGPGGAGARRGPTSPRSRGPGRPRCPGSRTGCTSLSRSRPLTNPLTGRPIGPPHRLPSSRPPARPPRPAPRPGSGFDRLRSTTSRRVPGRRPATTQPPGDGELASAVPASVKIACILTWVFSGLVALMYAGTLIALVTIQDQIVDYVVDQPEWQRANVPDDILLPALWLTCLAMLAWSLGACVLAWFTWRRHNWARWLLATSAAAAFLVGLLAFPFGLLAQLAAVLTIVGLFLSTSRDWFEPWSAGPPPPGAEQGPHWGPPSGPPLDPPSSYPSGPPEDQQSAGPARRQAACLVISRCDQPRCRSVARNRRSPSTIRSCSLQNAHLIRWRPCSEPSS